MNKKANPEPPKVNPDSMFDNQKDKLIDQWLVKYPCFNGETSLERSKIAAAFYAGVFMIIEHEYEALPWMIWCAEIGRIKEDEILAYMNELRNELFTRLSREHVESAQENKLDLSLGEGAKN